MEIAGKKFFIIGAARSGISCALYLEKHGASVILTDTKSYDDLYNEGYGIEKTRENRKITLILGRQPYENELDGVSLVVLSPGVPPDIHICNYARSIGIEVVSEIEFANSFYKGSLVGITGTNGKTTTTYMTGALLKAVGLDSHVCGNIGFPFIDYVDSSDEDTVLALELSSFQLSMEKNLKPKVAIITNITPDHLDRHKTMENYIAAKANIFKNMSSNDLLILNYDDEIVRSLATKAACKIKYFSITDKNADAYLDDDSIYVKIDGSSVKLVEMSELKVIGKHNAANAMCAILATLYFSDSLDIIRNAMKEFEPVEHRVEFVRELDGVRYINDSKGTNPDAAMIAIKAMKTPVLLLIGGYDKHSDFSDIMLMIKERVKKIYIFGQTTEKIVKCAKECGYCSYMIVENMEQAINAARNDAEPGDTVLLSPACASWDQFDNFEQRGAVFKQLVRNF